jgi:cytidylate kinase
MTPTERFSTGRGVLETIKPYQENGVPGGAFFMRFSGASVMNINVITVAREYGAGGYELAYLLAESLGWELLDRELLYRAAAVEHLPDDELERLDEKAISLADRFRLHPPHQRYLHGLREAARQATAKGNVVLVGRGTSFLIEDTPNVLHLRLVAPREWRARRMSDREGWTYEYALARCAQEDSTRDRFLRYFFGDLPFQLARYALIANTARVPLGDVAVSVVALVRADIGPEGEARRGGKRRVLTLSRELGAGDRSFVQSLGKRLGLHVYDRELLEQEATQLGVTEEEMEKIDEHPAGIFQRFRPGSLYQRYFEALGQLMKELAAQGNVLLVGRGGNRFLSDDEAAFHVRLVAPMEVRLRRVMEHRWLREKQARQLIAQSDSERRSFYENYFGADWTNPLEYHLTVNTGRLGPAAVDLIASAAERHWARVG